MPPEVVARVAINGMFKLKPVIIPGFFNQLNRILMKLVPDKIKIPLISSHIKRELGSENIPRVTQLNKNPNLSETNYSFECSESNNGRIIFTNSIH